jgi:hypothetical protein
MCGSYSHVDCCTEKTKVQGTRTSLENWRCLAFQEIVFPWLDTEQVCPAVVLRVLYSKSIRIESQSGRRLSWLKDFCDNCRGNVWCRPRPLPFLLSRSMCDSRRGFGLYIGFIDHFITQLVITLKYSAIADFHALQVFSSPQCLH